MIVIRNLRPADRDAVIFIHKQSIYGLCRDYYTNEEMKSWTDRLTPELFDEGIKDKNSMGVVAVDSNFLVGYGFINLRDQELRALYVLPRFTNLGADRLILARLEVIAIERKIKKLSLLSTKNAEGFYRKSGYQAIRAEGHMIDELISIDCIRMEKMLG